MILLAEDEEGILQCRGKQLKKRLAVNKQADSAVALAVVGAGSSPTSSGKRARP